MQHWKINVIKRLVREFTQLVWDGGIHYLHISAILFVVSFTLMKHSTINLI